MSPSLLNMMEDHAYHADQEVKRLHDLLALEKVKIETTVARNETLEAEVDRLKEFEVLARHYQARLRKIAEHPDTPEIIRQYARGEIR